MDNEKLSFQILTVEDIPQLKDIMIDDDACYNPEQIKKFIITDGNLTFGALIDGKIIGLIYGYSLCKIDKERPQFFIYSVRIHSSYQNKGYGSQFFQYVVEYCRENDYDEVFVPTDKGNTRACRVYEKAGGKNDYDDEIIYVINFAK